MLGRLLDALGALAQERERLGQATLVGQRTGVDDAPFGHELGRRRHRRQLLPQVFDLSPPALGPVAVHEHGVLVDGVAQVGVGLELLGRSGVVPDAVLAEAGELADARRVGELLAQGTQDAQRLALAVVGEGVGGGHEGAQGAVGVATREPAQLLLHVGGPPLAPAPGRCRLLCTSCGARLRVLDRPLADSAQRGTLRRGRGRTTRRPPFPGATGALLPRLFVTLVDGVRTEPTATRLGPLVAVAPLRLTPATPLAARRSGRSLRSVSGTPVGRTLPGRATPARAPRPGTARTARSAATGRASSAVAGPLRRRTALAVTAAASSLVCHRCPIVGVARARKRPRRCDTSPMHRADGGD